MGADLWINCDIDAVFDELSFTCEEIGRFIKQAHEYYSTGKIPTIREWDRLKNYVANSDPCEEY
jgi:hypothetical protein